MDKKTYLDLLDEKNIEIERLKKELEILKKKSSFDVTTKVKNKRECINALNCEMKKAEHGKSTFSICFADIDGFKRINDELGHCEGDNILLELSQTIKRNIRCNDEIFRYGGDEFVVLFPGTNKKEAQNIWRRVVSKIEESFEKSKVNYPVKLSVGFTEYNKNRKLEVKDLINDADLNMYKQKKLNNTTFMGE